MNKRIWLEVKKYENKFIKKCIDNQISLYDVKYFKDHLEVLIDVKKEVDKPIWIWSGFTLDQILEDPEKEALLEEIDVLVDGKFVERLKDLSLKFRGSSNQRIIYLQNQ